MDPALRRQLDEAEQYRHLNLPSEDASVMRFPKRLLGRVGFVMLGEQRRYNRAVLQALHQLTGAVDELRLTVEDLQRDRTGRAGADDPTEGDEPT